MFKRTGKAKFNRNTNIFVVKYFKLNHEQFHVHKGKKTNYTWSFF